MRYRLIACLLMMCGILAFAGCSSGTSNPGSSAQRSLSSSSGSIVYEPVPSDFVLPQDKWGNLFSIKGEDAVAFGERVQTDLPVKAYVCWQGEGGGEPIYFNDPDTIRRLFNALATSNIGGEAFTVTTDDYTSIGFEFSDGSKFGMMFDSMALQVKQDGVIKYYNVMASNDLSYFADLARHHSMDGF